MSPSWGHQGCLGLEWGVPHMLFAWGYELQVLQVSSHQERGAQPVILQDLAMDVLCLTARTGLCCWEMWGVVQFSKCSSSLYLVYPLSTQTPWSLCLLPSAGTCLFISEPVELGEDTVTASSQAVNELKSWHTCSQDTPGAVAPTPSLRGQWLPIPNVHVQHPMSMSNTPFACPAPHVPLPGVWISTGANLAGWNSLLCYTVSMQTPKEEL